MQNNHPRFLYPNPLAKGGQGELSSDESTHALRVLRLKEGDGITLIDGKGQVAEAKIVSTTKKTLSFEIGSVDFHPVRSKITLAFSIPKSGALEILLRKVTEIGVQRFQPLVSEHSLHPDSWNTGRWERVLAEACKQCQDPYLPICEQPLSLTQWMGKRDRDWPLFFCDEEARDEKASIPASAPGTDILVGAEGGWSETERQLILGAGARKLGLGKNRLRAETAAIVAVT